MNNNKDILSINYDDDNEDYESFDEYLNEHTNRQKVVALNEIDKMGDELLNEIDRKKNNKELKKSKLIPYILKYCNNKYDDKVLLSYSFEDVLSIYNEIKEERKPLIFKLFRFIFNL